MKVVLSVTVYCTHSLEREADICTHLYPYMLVQLDCVTPEIGSCLKDHAANRKKPFKPCSLYSSPTVNRI